ncbi:MAG: hypothetical protein MOIL_01781 [Candidatus Methanolliviera sp. GoM_oil]|nr:MAG: hypothetical protein MOIL_01781 [Candidatus Methanolliviera sp. GoM_oil]
MKKSGTADLPLHGGRTPRWLFDRMVKLAGGISEIIILEYGEGEFLKRISDPFWFQSLSCIIGFDWHSSGTTTTTCGALKVALNPEKDGIAVAGGKGKASKKTSEEIRKASEIFSLSDEKVGDLIYKSRMSAKIDNSCLQDGFDLYHHCLFLDEHGNWVVVQQGMSDTHARRYHWLSSNIESIVVEPHSAICGEREENYVLDMTSIKSEETRKISVDIIKDNPRHIERYLTGNTTLSDFSESGFPEDLKMPKRHEILRIDLGKRGIQTLKKIYEIQPKNYEELVSIRGVGKKTIRSLALVSNVIYGSKLSWKDPVTYSYAHGGKDGHPFPVQRREYDESIEVLKNAVKDAKIERKEKLRALKRMSDFLEG